MRHLLLTFLLCIFITMSLASQIGLHLGQHGYGLHYRMHADNAIAFEANLGFIFSSGSEGLIHSRYGLSAGFRWNFYQKNRFTLYTGLRGDVEFSYIHGNSFPSSTYGLFSYPINKRSALNLGYTVPIGVSWLMGKDRQFEMFFETGISSRLNRNPNFLGHLKLGSTYYFNRN